MQKPNNLLSIEADAKTVKGNKVNVLTGILYMAPHNISGYQVCPKASDGCKLACLYTAGRGVYTKVQNARLAKTKWFFTERKSFMEQLVKNIKQLEAKAYSRGMIPTIRLNGTSDIAWEKFKCFYNGTEYANVMQAFPDVKFYDYTKIIGRKTALSLPNYHLTFSLAENNDRDAKLALKQGYNVAVVLNIRRGEKKPETWSGFPVVDGDDSDVRFFDPKGGYIVALTAKGKARHDTTGFVRKIDDSLKG